MSLHSTLAFIVNHPLCRDRPGAAVRRFVTWQIRSRLASGAVSVPFVDRTSLILRRGMTGGTGNAYCGLHEYPEMAFLLHVLRPTDLFVDVGSNIGSYTVLAAGAVGAQCIAFEPVKLTKEWFLKNVTSNGISERVRLIGSAVGDQRGQVCFRTDLDTMNSVVAEDALVQHETVQMTTLDDELVSESPTLIKIDVEGLQDSVLRGASKVLDKSSLVALIVEGGSGAETASYLGGHGFNSVDYDPLSRRLSLCTPDGNDAGNVIFVRDINAVQTRVVQSKTYKLLPVNKSI
jgi:FkbM family methyltransferase